MDAGMRCTMHCMGRGIILPLGCSGEKLPQEDGLLPLLSLHFRVSPEPEWNLLCSRGENLKVAGGMGILRGRPPKPVTRKPAQGKDGEVNPGRRVSRKDFGSECTIS